MASSSSVGHFAPGGFGREAFDLRLHVRLLFAEFAAGFAAQQIGRGKAVVRIKPAGQNNRGGVNEGDVAAKRG